MGGILANNNYPAEFVSELANPNNVIHAAHLKDVQNYSSLVLLVFTHREVQQPMREDALLTGILEPTNEPYAIAKIRHQNM